MHPIKSKTPLFISGAFILATIVSSPKAFARDAIADSVAGVFTEGGSTLPYRYYSPDGGTDPSEDFPLILFLHGNGERGTNNTSQVTTQIQGLIDHTQSGATAAYLLAPQAPSGGQSLQWTNQPYGNGAYSNPSLTVPNLTTPLKLALDLVDQFIATHNVDPSRIYITGLSMGGYGTWDAIARRPDLFAAAAPLSGGGNLSMAGTYDGIPIWAIHGSADGTVPVSGSQDTIKAIVNSGGTLARYTEIAGGGHGGWAAIYNGASYSYDTNYNGAYSPDGTSDIYTWMFAQTKAVPEPSTIALGVMGGVLLWIRRRRHD